MSRKLSTEQDRLWAYMILPILLLFLGGILAYGVYYALAALQPELVAGIPPGPITFGPYIFIAVMEWMLATTIQQSTVQLKRRDPDGRWHACRVCDTTSTNGGI